MPNNRESRAPQICDYYAKNDPAFNIRTVLKAIEGELESNPEAIEWKRQWLDLYTNDRFSQLLKYPDLDRCLINLNWPSLSLNEFSNPVWHYIATKNIRLNVNLYWAYHGTSLALQASIHKNGLDTSKGETINPGAIVTNNTCGTTNFSQAHGFAEQTTYKIAENKGGIMTKLQSSVEGFNLQTNYPVVYRWRILKPETYGQIVVSDGNLNAHNIDFSVDQGQTWYPAAMFNIAIQLDKAIPIPNYEREEIKLLDQHFAYKQRDFLERFLDTLLCNPAPPPLPPKQSYPFLLKAIADMPAPETTLTPMTETQNKEEVTTDFGIEKQEIPSRPPTPDDMYDNVPKEPSEPDDSSSYTQRK